MVTFFLCNTAFQPSGRDARLPEVYCIVSCIGCFGLFSKVCFLNSLFPEIQKTFNSLLGSIAEIYVLLFLILLHHKISFLYFSSSDLTQKKGKKVRSLIPDIWELTGTTHRDIFCSFREFSPLLE